MGGGVAGMQTALRLAARGIEAVIVEKETELGGKLRGWHVLFPSFTPAGEVLSDLRGRDALLSTAHFGCWEYDSFLALYTGEHYLAAVYHPLENKVIDAVYMRLRRRRNIRLIPMKEIIRYYIDHRLPAGAPGQRIGIGLIADQNPPLRPNSHWFRFLNQDTIFFDGGEKLALRCNLPVYFVKMNRLRRGRYEMSFELIYDGKEEVAEYEITQRYVRKLERMICECPELWMWSHRRWKHKRTHAGR